MIRVTILYPQKEGARFDWAYYTGTHMPLVAARLGSAVKATSVEQGVAGGAPGTPAPFVAIVHLTFESVPAYLAALGPHAAELMADLRNFTTIEPVFQVSEVKLVG